MNKSAYMQTPKILSLFIKHITCLLILVMVVTSVVTAQVHDDFEDGDLSVNPTWFGELNKFTTTSAGACQLMAPSAGTAYMSIPIAVSDAYEWAWESALDFAPSGSNKIQYYLWADSEDLAQANQAYYLEVGESGSDDVLYFKERNAGTVTTITQSATGLFGADFSMDILVKKSSDDFVATGSVNSLSTTLWQANANLPQGSGYFGWVCTFTSSRIEGFQFDNVAVDTTRADITGPILESVEVIDQQTLRLHFDEMLDAPNMAVSLSGGIAVSALSGTTMTTMVEVTLAQPLVTQTDYTVTAELARDLAGNETATQHIDFTYINLKSVGAHDWMLTEIMADPSPVVALPAVEYVEILNLTNDYTQLDQGEWIVNGASVTLTDTLKLGPNERVILCDMDDVAVLSAYGQTMGLPTWKTLVNGGAEIQLRNAGVEVFTITYSDSWYQDSQKDDGGYSLENNFPYRICTASNLSWKASNDASGGTPGQLNSVENSDRDPSIEFLEVTTISADQLEISLNVSASDIGAATASHFELVPAVPIDLVVASDDLVMIYLSEPMDSLSDYTIIYHGDGLLDCTGQLIADQTQADFYFGDPQVGDILINEILFNAPTGGSDYVEFVNTSNRAISLSNFYVQNLAKDPIQEDALQTNQFKQIESQMIIAYTEDSMQVRSHFAPPDSARIAENALPTFDDDEGIVVLIYRKGNTSIVIDSFTYSKDWHSPWISDDDGIALEKTQENALSSFASNWKSAASTVQYGTPGYRNSQYLAATISDDDLHIEPAVISPNGDGYQDYLTATLSIANRQDVRLDAWIFDERGRQVKTLVNGGLPLDTTTITWDGLDENSNKAAAGIYLLMVEWVNDSGKTHRQVKRFGLIHKD